MFWHGDLWQRGPVQSSLLFGCLGWRQMCGTERGCPYSSFAGDLSSIPTSSLLHVGIWFARGRSIYAALQLPDPVLSISCLPLLFLKHWNRRTAGRSSLLPRPKPHVAPVILSATNGSHLSPHMLMHQPFPQWANVGDTLASCIKYDGEENINRGF